METPNFSLNKTKKRKKKGNRVKNRVKVAEAEIGRDDVMCK